MLASLKKYWLFYLTVALFCFTIWIFFLNFKDSKRELTFAVLDIGQGDAIFIESPTGTQVLVDAGPPRKIISQLARVMSPLDRRIDAVIITNPDADHIGGFTDVLKNYQVDQVFEPGTSNDSKTYQNLETEIKNKNIPKILAKKGMRLDIGGGAVIDILFPDRDVSEWTSNDGSIVARLVYGDNEIMLTGDTTIKTEEIILKTNAPDGLRSDILKVAHHGSHTSTSLAFAKAVAPTYAVISDGKDNKYGHPHEETISTLLAIGAHILRTDLDGTIVFKCDTILPCVIKKSKN